MTDGRVMGGMGETAADVGETSGDSSCPLLEPKLTWKQNREIELKIQALACQWLTHLGITQRVFPVMDKRFICQFNSFLHDD